MLAGELVYTTIKSLFKDRVYADRLPEGITERPAAVYQYISSNAVNTLDEGYAGMDAVRLQVDIYDRTFEGAMAKAAAVRSALTASGLALPVLYLGYRNLSEPETQQARVSIDFSIWEQP